MIARINEIPFGRNCYTIKKSLGKNNIVNKKYFCPYLIYLENGYKMCLLQHVESCDDDFLEKDIKNCGINEDI